MVYFRFFNLLTLIILTINSVCLCQNQISEFANLINSADKTKLSSIEYAADQFKIIFSKKTNAEKDSAIVLFWDFYNTVVNQQAEELNNRTLPSYYSNFIGITDYPSEKTISELNKSGVQYNKEDLAYLADINKYGGKIVNEEGMYYIKFGSTIYFESKFKSVLSENTFNYFIKSIQEESEPLSYDGAIGKDLNKIADDLIWWENFLNNDLLDYYKEYGKYHYNNLLFTLLEGQDNTPAFDYSSKKLSKKFNKCYDYIVVKYKGTKSAEIFKEYMDLLKKSKGKKSKQIEEFISNL